MRTYRLALILVAFLAVPFSIRAEEPPQVPQEQKAKLADLQQQAAGYQRSIAALQEKLDVVTMEYGRTVQAIQAAQPAYDLTPQMTYVPKPKPDAKPEKSEGKP